VLSLQGWVPFSNCRRTRKEQEVVKVIFNNGASVVCTKDHKFLTIDHEWVEAKDLTNVQCHINMVANPIMEGLSWKLKSFLTQFKSLMGSGIGVEEAKERNISGEHPKKNDRKGFTGQYGNTIMGLFQRDFMSIIRIVTRQIMALGIWSLGLLTTICRSIAKKLTMTRGLNLCTEAPLSGMEAQKEGNGIRSIMRNIARLRCSIKKKVKYAQLAAKSLAESHGLNTVQEPASNGPIMLQVWLDAKNQEFVSCAEKNSLSQDHQSKKIVRENVVLSQQKENVSMVKMVNLYGTADVYCLSVPHPHAFTLANGIVVHNCFDEACHICMSRPIELIIPEPTKTEAQKHIEKITKMDKGDYESAYLREQAMQQALLSREMSGGGGYSDVDER
jgi:hypothetical protein